MNNKITLTLICFFANFIIAGFACQFGMLIQPIASYFQQNIQHVVPIFSLLHLGSLIGTIIAYFLIERMGLKKISILCYLIIFICCILLYSTHSFILAALCLILVGIGGGVSMCIAGTLLVELWQKRIRATLLVMQDLIFNSAGIIFPIITTYALTHQLRWSFSYLLAALLCLLVILLILNSRFDITLPYNTTEKKSVITHAPLWNFRVILGGSVLFISMLALYTFLTWLPLFISHKFEMPFVKAGTLITHYWSAALIGSLLFSLLATCVNIRLLLLISMAAASLATYLLFTTHSVGWVSPLIWIYGLTCAAPYNIFIAYGVSFSRQPSSKMISYILFNGGLGSMLSPLISPWLEQRYGLSLMVLTVPLLYAIVFLLILLCCYRANANSVP